MLLEPIIGLEIHVQLKTKSKMFCRCQNGVENPPNSAICPICMGHPGTLPVPNREAVMMALRSSLALGCTIPEVSKFDRKNYFYPDLPKGYQISQYDKPLSVDGCLDIEYIDREKKKIKKTIKITRLHMEEDAAKLLHTPDGDHSLVDFNRAGTPLIEIVTEPDFRSPEEAKVFLEELRRIMRMLDVSDADMEKGQLRCDANISMRPHPGTSPQPSPARRGGTEEEKFYPKTEVKNMNSFRAVERALAYEIQRQTKLWEKHTPPIQQTTRGWNDTTQETEEQRIKEESNDYRYFPEPDIPPLHFDPKEIETIQKSLPELPLKKRSRFVDQYAMESADALLLSEETALANFTEQAISELRSWLKSDRGEETAEDLWSKNKKRLVKLVTGWITSKLFQILHEKNISLNETPLTPERFAELIKLLYETKVNSTTAQGILAAMVEKGIDPHDYIREQKLEQVSDEETIAENAEAVIADHAEVVATYKKGKTGALQFLIGQVMKKMGGKANPVVIEKIFKKLLKQ